MKKWHWFTLFVLGPALGATLVLTQLYYYISLWTYDGPDVVFHIKSGEAFASINHRLRQDRLISNPKVFYRLSKYRNLLTKFKSGSYQIKSGSNMLDVQRELIYGSAITTKITIPEGKNLFEIGKILEENKITTYKEFVKLAKDKKFTRQQGIPADRLEGYLYPETYHFSPHTSAETVIRSMLNTFKNKTKNLDFKRSHLNKHQVITLASIVEKETGAAFERPMIAGVYLNRLKKPMRLFADPTTIYGIYEHFNGNLTKQHLRQKTPYNTYKIDGLPQGPIANPGLDSIKAVLNPKKHAFYYFVSRNDGTHIFSRDYKEHRKAVREYQQNRRNRVGKSWRDLRQ